MKRLMVLAALLAVGCGADYQAPRHHADVRAVLEVSESGWDCWIAVPLKDGGTMRFFEISDGTCKFLVKQAYYTAPEP